MLHLFQASEDKNLFVRFKKITSNCDTTIIFSCLHEISVASSASKQQKICCSAEIKVNINPHHKGQGGGANISTLHAHSNIHFPKIARIVTTSLLAGQKKLQCFFSKKDDAAVVDARSTGISFVGTLSTQCTTVSEFTPQDFDSEGNSDQIASFHSGIPTASFHSGTPMASFNSGISRICSLSLVLVPLSAIMPDHVLVLSFLSTRSSSLDRCFLRLLRVSLDEGVASATYVVYVRKNDNRFHD